MSKVAGFIVIAALLAGFSGISPAETMQPPVGRGPAAMKTPKGELSDPEKRLAMMKGDLALSAEQLIMIRPVIVAEQEALEKLRGDNTLNREQRRVKLQELNKSTSEKVSAFLTPEQLQKYDAIRAKIIANRSKSRSYRPDVAPAEFTPELRIARLTERLVLSHEQQVTILPILQAEYVELKKLPSNDSYNREQRRARLQQLTRETNAKIMSLLTSEQQQKYAESREKMIDRRAQKKSAVERGQ